jgi:hypothetical protein
MTRPDPEARNPAQRSAVTNGRRLFIEGDQRSAWARRCKDIVAELAADAGGADAIPAGKMLIARSAAVMAVELEQLAARFSEGEREPGDLDVFQRTSNSLVRHLSAIGLERVAKDVTPAARDFYDRLKGGDK